MSHDPIETVIDALRDMAAEAGLDTDRGKLLRVCAAQARDVTDARNKALGYLRRARRAPNSVLAADVGEFLKTQPETT